MTTNTDAVPRLKPCPFCGEPVELEQARDTRDELYGVRQWWGVVCRSTLNRGGSCAIQQIPSASKEAAIERWNRRAPTPSVQAEVVRVDSIARLVAFHAEQLDSNPYCYFELAYTRQTDWMAWITDRPAQGEPGTAAYAKSRKVIVRGQGPTAEEACADALAALAASSAGDQGVERG